MSFKIFAGGALRTASSVKVKTGGVTRAVQTIKLQTPSGLKLIYQGFDPLTAAASGDASGFGTSATVQTNAVTVTPSGGIGPYAYSWSCTDHTGTNLPYAVAPTFATSNFREDMLVGESASSTFTCVVTDSLGHTASASITATFTRSGGGS